jgi:hypothetical protein
MIEHGRQSDEYMANWVASANVAMFGAIAPL